MATKKLTSKTSYSYSKIKWTKSDTARLNNAIRTFNKEVKKHLEDIPEKYLPKLKEYQKVKSEIYSRKDLELAISTMKRIKNKNAFNLISSKANSNVKITNWELQTAKRYDRQNQVKLQMEYNKVLESIEKGETKVMKNAYGEPITDKSGNKIVQAVFSDTYKNKLEGYLKETNVEMLLRSEDNYRKDLLLERIYRRGGDLFEYKKSEIYRENYLRSIEDYQNLDHYEEVVNYIKNMDAREFFKKIQKADENGYNNFSDHYDNRMVQADFNLFAERLGYKFSKSEKDIEPVTEPFDL